MNLKFGHSVYLARAKMECYIAAVKICPANDKRKPSKYYDTVYIKENTVSRNNVFIYDPQNGTSAPPFQIFWRSFKNSTNQTAVALNVPNFYYTVYSPRLFVHSAYCSVHPLAWYSQDE